LRIKIVSQIQIFRMIATFEVRRNFCLNRGCRMFLGPNIHTKTGKIYQRTSYKVHQAATYCHILYQMSVNYRYQHFPFQGPPKYARIGTFGLKINNLATLLWTGMIFYNAFMNI
jgi:hypothetical protein